MWDLIVTTAHVHIDKFQVLRWNEGTLTFLSYVRFVNEAQYLIDYEILSVFHIYSSFDVWITNFCPHYIW